MSLAVAESTRCCWHAGDDDWDIHRNAAVDEDATAASAPLLGAQDGSPGGSSNTGIQVCAHTPWSWHPKPSTFSGHQHLVLFRALCVLLASLARGPYHVAHRR